MYARNTPTRMKGSAVVQGLKSLAAKLHPQLPLSPKESQRLLTALTSSFRKQLDQAHPPRTGVLEGKQPGNVGLSNGDSGQLHSSSAAFADRHLASVLTNPLLTKGTQAKKRGLDYASARIELQANPTKDPISLLEEYDKQNAATIPIARFCLEKFKQTVENLPKEKRQNEILSTKAGARTLLLVWNSKLYEADAFSDDIGFIELLASFVVREGSEEYLWDWYKIDMPLGHPKATHAPLSGEKARSYSYRWKGRMLRAIVQAKLDGNSDMSANDALDAFFRACDIRKNMMKQAWRVGPNAHQYPLLPALILLSQALHHSLELRANTDFDRYDLFIERAEFYYGLPGDKGYREFQVAKLMLKHPRPSSQSALPALRFLKRIFAPGPIPDETIHRYLTQPKGKKQLQHFFLFMIDTAALLREDDRNDDADWVLSLIRELYPSLSPFIEAQMNEKSISPVPQSLEAPSEKEDSQMPKQILFPTFV